MRHWIGVYFSVPDSELKKNCKEAGLFWQWTETFILFFSLSVSCLMHFFFVIMPWFLRLPVAYWGVYMECSFFWF
jgi:hypothetical protein